MGSQVAFEQRQEVPFLDKNTSIGGIRDVRLLRRLIDYLCTSKQKTGIDYVVGEWVSHRGFEVIPIGHGIYDPNSAAKLRQQYGRGDPFFSFCPTSYLEQRLEQLNHTVLRGDAVHKGPIGQQA